MTKKEKMELQENITKTEREINNRIFQALGFDIKDSFVIDQDNFKIVKFKKKNLKYPDSAEQVPMHTNDIIFDPLNNTKLAIELFNIFLKKELEENGLYIQIYYAIVEGEKTAIEIQKVVGQEVQRLRSEFYKNPSYGYIEIILDISGVLLYPSSSYLHELEAFKSYEI